MRNYIKIPQFVKQIVGFIYIYKTKYRLHLIRCKRHFSF